MLTPTTKNLLGSALYCSKSNKGNRTKRNTSPIAGASTSSRRRPHHAQRYRTTMPRMCQDEKHCILYFVLANAQPSCSPRQRLRLTTCCAVLAATRSADFSAHRLEKESVGSERVAFLRQREKKAGWHRSAFQNLLPHKISTGAVWRTPSQNHHSANIFETALLRRIA